MDFIEFRNAIRKRFDEMSKSDNLFSVDLNKDEMWNVYLNAFPSKYNPIHRVRTVHDCSCCRHFIKQIGNVVQVKDGKVTTLWDVDLGDDQFQPVADALNEYILRNMHICDVFLIKEGSVGCDHNFANGDSMERYDHFQVDIPSKFLFRGRDTIDSARSQYRDTQHVFKRSLEELTLDSVDTVLDLISQNSLYRGEEWKAVLTQFRDFKNRYDKITDPKAKDIFAWENSVKAGQAVTRIRNHSMGTLLVNISEGMDLDQAVHAYEKIVAPTNYKRPKAIFTQKMLDDAKATITELGYLDSLRRRYARLDDITVNNILFSDKSVASRIQGAGDVFAEMSKDVKTSAKKFSKVEEVSIDKFLKDVLPTATGLELFFDGKLMPNMVSLIAPEVQDSKSMFKWDNNFSWAYTGNIADSAMKERVKSAGGKVDGDLRFSIQWNDTEVDKNDLDAHCRTPRFHIFFGDKVDRHTHGELDVDIIDPSDKPAVENITWASRTTMVPGEYQFYVNCYTNRGGRSGFRAEIEFDGEIYTFDYTKALRQGENVQVATVILDDKGNFTIKTHLDAGSTSREVWGLQTNQFVPVSVVCYSPNYWNEQNGIGNKHYFFMLKDCANPENPNAFYNEFLKSELDTHKRVFEALGSRLHVIESPDQLSGVGFSSTKRAEIIVKVMGAAERILKIKF